jgi:hypothetical protein
MLEIINLYFFYTIFIFSSIGYGSILTSKINKIHICELGFIGLSGIFFLTIISYLTNFVFKHGYVHNSIIVILGLFSFFYFIKKNFFKIKSEFFLLILIFFILFIAILLTKNHDDFFYYHFQYTFSLIEFKKIIGIGLLEHGYRTPSSIFYLNSLFYLPGIGLKFINGGAILVMGFCNLYLLHKIILKLKSGTFDFIFYLLLLSFTFINTLFYRISEHGTDRSALILIFIFCCIYLESINYNQKLLKQNLFKDFNKLIVILSLIVSFKSFYIIYSILIFFWIIELKEYCLNRKFFKEILLKNYFTYFSFFLVFFTIFTMFLNTGCFIYPASFTCLDSFEWSINVTEVTKMKEWYELWSKAGANPNYRVQDASHYLSNFNWVWNWFNDYFFNKISDFLFALSIILMVFFFTFRAKKIPNYNNKNKFLLLYFLLLLFFFEWFINHPALRYGGYSIIALMLFIPFSNYLSTFFQNKNVMKTKINFILLLTITIFLAKNIDRIFNEYKKYNYNPLVNPYFHIIDDAYQVDKLLKKIEEKYNYSSQYLILNKNLIDKFK